MTPGVSAASPPRSTNSATASAISSGVLPSTVTGARNGSGRLEPRVMKSTRRLTRLSYPAYAAWSVLSSGPQCDLVPHHVMELGQVAEVVGHRPSEEGSPLLLVGGQCSNRAVELLTNPIAGMGLGDGEVLTKQDAVTGTAVVVAAFSDTGNLLIRVRGFRADKVRRQPLLDEGHFCRRSAVKGLERDVVVGTELWRLLLLVAS